MNEHKTVKVVKFVKGVLTTTFGKVVADGMRRKVVECSGEVTVFVRDVRGRWSQKGTTGNTVRMEQQ